MKGEQTSIDELHENVGVLLGQISSLAALAPLVTCACGTHTVGWLVGRQSLA
jgi:hypothetical protein